MCLSLNNFCCCISLSAGAKIVSVISTAVSASTLVLYGTPAILQMFSLPPARAIFYGVTAVAALFKTIFGCMLIHGTFRKKPSFTWPWLLVSWVFCVALTTLSIAGIIFLSYNKDSENNAEISSVISVYFLYSIVLFYFISVVNSRRQEMIEDEFSYTSKRVRKMNSYYYS